MSGVDHRPPAPASRRERNYKAFLAHRISGVALAIFLPLHFLALGLALESHDRFASFIAFTDHPLVKFAEWGLVIFLGAHLLLGLRLIVLELAPWKGMRLVWINWSVLASVTLAVVFLAVLTT